MKIMIYTAMILALASCKLGEIDVNTPTNFDCTGDGWQTDASGQIIVDEAGLALSCTAT